MDHAYHSLEVFLSIEIDNLYSEWKSGKYPRLSECPSYKAAKALNDASNILRKYMNWNRLTLRDYIKFMEDI